MLLPQLSSEGSAAACVAVSCDEAGQLSEAAE